MKKRGACSTELPIKLRLSTSSLLQFDPFTFTKRDEPQRIIRMRMT